MRRLPSLLWIAATLSAQTPDAAEIMRRVSENVGRAEAARAAWVYDQDVFARLKRANGKLAREEGRQYTVAPTDKGAERKLVKVEGKILEGKNEVAYTEAGYRRKDVDIDGALVDTFARTWKRFDKDVWFPVQTGGELKLRVLFLYARTIAFSAANRDFRKADVQSKIEFGAPVVPHRNRLVAIPSRSRFGLLWLY